MSLRVPATAARGLVLWAVDYCGPCTCVRGLLTAVARARVCAAVHRLVGAPTHALSRRRLASISRGAETAMAKRVSGVFITHRGGGLPRTASTSGRRRPMPHGLKAISTDSLGASRPYLWVTWGGVNCVYQLSGVVLFVSADSLGWSRPYLLRVWDVLGGIHRWFGKVYAVSPFFCT